MQCDKTSTRRNAGETHERFCGDIGPRLVDGSEVGSYNGECDDLYGEGRSVEDECGHELARGLALGTCEFGPAGNT